MTDDESDVCLIDEAEKAVWKEVKTGSCPCGDPDHDGEGHAGALHVLNAYLDQAYELICFEKTDVARMFLRQNAVKFFTDMSDEQKRNGDDEFAKISSGIARGFARLADAPELKKIFDDNEIIKIFDERVM